MVKLAIVGVGNESKGDDAAGVLAIRKLSDLQGVLVLEGGTSPENVTPPLRRFSPSWVIFVDSVDFGGRPGEFRVFDPLKTSGSHISTHTLPLSLLSKYLEVELGARVLLVGIQPKSLEGPVSAEVGLGVERVAVFLRRVVQMLATSRTTKK
jgi:hydrogenase 3 maturation protease